MPTSRRVGLFGGAFDPPHRAHRVLVEAALAELRLDRVLVLPTGQAWHKPRDLTDMQHRVAMAQLAFADLAAVQVDLRETLRSGATYTVDTLRELRAEQPGAEFFLIIGQDQAEALHQWRAWEVVVQLAIICVALRPNASGAPPRYAPPCGLEHRFVPLLAPAMAVSATAIRAKSARGEPLVPLVCDAVARYIALHRLYQTT
ncbi:MAG: nicotinate (nicotinamide) nucleotide adenylyltransferase [Burkholderiaceae bacterium]